MHYIPPSQRQLMCYTQRIDATPGFSHAAFCKLHYLAEVAKNNGQGLHVNLVLNEMKLHKHILCWKRKDYEMKKFFRTILSKLINFKHEYEQIYIYFFDDCRLFKSEEIHMYGDLEMYFLL